MSCTSPRSYLVSLPSDQSLTELLWNRQDDGTADTSMSAGQSSMNLVIPSLKKAGTANGNQGVQLFWSSTTTAPNPAAAEVLLEIPPSSDGSGFVTVDVTHLAAGWFWARQVGDADVELHVWEGVW